MATNSSVGHQLMTPPPIQSLSAQTLDKGEIRYCSNNRCPLSKRPKFTYGREYCNACGAPYDIEVKIQKAVVIQKKTINRDSLDIANVVKTFRRKRHLSQTGLGARLNCPRTYVSKVENGRVIPTLENCERFAHALDVEIVEFFKMACPSLRYERIRFIHQDPFLQELVYSVIDMDESERKKLLERLSIQLMSASRGSGGIQKILTYLQGNE